MSDEEHFIYHERQEALLCGQHALNNLVQRPEFSVADLSSIAHQLDQMELNFMRDNDEGGIYSKDYIQRVAEGSGNIDPSGNFSIEVLRSALLTRYNLSLVNIRQEGVSKREPSKFEGFICNKDSHWFAIRSINGRFWNLNSTLERPEMINGFKLSVEIDNLQNTGYSVFCILGEESGCKLPAPCTTIKNRGDPKFWWKEADLVEGKTNAATGASDHWNNLKTGRRLDNGSNASTMSNIDSSGLTEEEMIQLAMQASLEASHQSEVKDSSDQPIFTEPLKPEPPSTDPDAVRIQFRLPNNTRVIRRFSKSDLVATLYQFAIEISPNQNGSTLELKAHFPPKDISDQKSLTIDEAKLSNAAIQAVFI